MARSASPARSRIPRCERASRVRGRTALKRQVAIRPVSTYSSLMFAASITFFQRAVSEAM